MFPQIDKKIVATIEARMTSSRLPGKVLKNLGGRPALQLLIERLKRSKYIDAIVVATTINDADEPIVELAKKLDVEYFRGSEEDVLSRVLGAAQSVNADIITEITGDCPLLDVELIDQGIEMFFEKGVDYLGNVTTDSFPIGFDVQVFPTKILEKVDKLTQDPIDRVHVSYYIYQHPETFSLYLWKAEGEYHWPELRITLDEQKDFEFLEKICQKLLLVKENFNSLDVISLLKNDPSLLEINKHVKQKNLEEG